MIGLKPFRMLKRGGGNLVLENLSWVKRVPKIYSVRLTRESDGAGGGVATADHIRI